MTILEAENQNLRRRMRELELEFRRLQETHARVLKENEQLKGHKYLCKSNLVFCSDLAQDGFQRLA